MSDGIKKEKRHKIIILTNALFPGAKIYLFGSRAAGTYDETSDIDIAVDTGEKINPQDLYELQDILAASSVVRKIDVVDYRRASADFLEEIDRNKVEWKT
jgi:uncharacterized protein